MSSQHATGFVLTREGKRGAVFYASLKLPDGTQPRRRLGKVWTKRTRPPAGYLTRGMAEARLAAILARDDPLVNLEPVRATWGQAIDEWLLYVEHEKGVRPSTLRGYSKIAERHMRAAFGEDTPLGDVRTDAIDGYRSGLLRAGKLSRRSVQQILVAMYGALEHAKRKGWIDANPAANAQKVALKRSGDFRVLDPGEVVLLASKAGAAKTRRSSPSRRSPGSVWARCSRCGGRTSISASDSCMSGVRGWRALRTPRSRTRCGPSR
jgi:hypothetical protein